MYENKIPIPGTNEYLQQGYKVKLGRFNTEKWVLNHGWFEYDGNKPMCGWYLTNIDTFKIKPLLKPDLIDIYIVEF